MDALTTVEAAARLGISEEGVRKAIRAGRLPIADGPYPYLITEAAVVAYAAGRARRAAGGDACPVCGQPVPGQADGTPRVYCSERCVKAAYRRAASGMAIDGSGQVVACDACGRAFRRHTTAHMYCTKRCRQRAFLARQRMQMEARP